MEIMARYGEAADVAWKMGRIMLKYRPIAPKPVTGGSLAPGPADTRSTTGRGKRRGGAGVREGCSRRGRKRTKRSPPAAADPAPGVFQEDQRQNNAYASFTAATPLLPPPPVVTLPLMPVTPERKEYSSPATPSPTASDGNVAVGCFGSPTWRRQQHVVTTATTTNTTTNSSSSGGSFGSGSSVVVAPRPVRPVGSWVTVECITDTWRDGEIALQQACSSADVLERDTCPVFISNSCDQVTWTNAAYRKMVVGPVDDEGEEVAGTALDGGEEDPMKVALVTKGLVLDGVRCFTCRVRVRYACRRRGKASMAVPCDVWRLADGKLAWRLDVKAALSLSLVN